MRASWAECIPSAPLCVEKQDCPLQLNSLSCRLGLAWDEPERERTAWACSSEEIRVFQKNFEIPKIQATLFAHL